MCMLKQTKWPVLTVVAVAFLVALLLSGGLTPLSGVLSTLLTTPRQGPVEGGACTQYGPSFGGNVVIAGNQVVCSDLISFGATVAIHGIVKGNVVAFGGSIILDGTVDGNLNLYGGMAALQSGSHVHGDIHLYAAQLVRARDARLDGAVIDRSQHLTWFPHLYAGFSFPSLGLLIWVGLGLLVIWLLPEHVMLVRTTIVMRARRSLLVGLLSAILAPALLLLLSALIIPLPLAIIVAVGLIAGWALGMVALGLLIGERLLHAVAPQHHTRTFQVVLGLIVLTLAGSLPLVGWLISLGAGLLGLGAVFLSRFGTRLYGEPRYPLTL